MACVAGGAENLKGGASSNAHTGERRVEAGPDRVSEGEPEPVRGCSGCFRVTRTWRATEDPEGEREQRRGGTGEPDSRYVALEKTLRGMATP
jgi:hypothetical protein